MTMKPTVLPPGEGQEIWQLGNRFTLKAAGDQTQGRYAILKQICAGAPPPIHVHENEEEAFYLLTGSVDLYLGDEVHRSKQVPSASSREERRTRSSARAPSPHACSS